MLLSDLTKLTYIHTFIRTKGPLWPLTMLCELKVIFIVLFLNSFSQYSEKFFLCLCTFVMYFSVDLLIAGYVYTLWCKAITFYFLI